LPLERQTSDEIMERLVLVKADFWKYEEEYRIVGDDSIDWGAKLEGRYLAVELDLLTGVTISMRMPATDEADLLAVIDAHRPGLPVWKAV
jgi:hypothetical protein